MEIEQLLPSLLMGSSTKIVMVVIDGLGGLRTQDKPSEIEAASAPNLDRLAAEGSSGLQTLVSPGITPGSGAGHLAIFGYDPLQFELGRGALSAAGLGFQLMPGDVAARVNFCTIDEKGVVVDRRAGRISTETNTALCNKILEGIEAPPGIEVFLIPEREHRALLVLRGEGLSAEIGDTDPQLPGLAPHHPAALTPPAEKTASALLTLLDQVKVLLAGETANFILLRGYDTLRSLPSFQERYGLTALGIAGYPMYVGIARLLGMSIAPVRDSWAGEVEELEQAWADYDFFYIHQKKTDSAGEDGDYDRKVAGIEEVDATIPRIMALEPDVICVTGDHSTPSPMMSHSWHPVPVVMRGRLVGTDRVERFNEQDAIFGGLGRLRGMDLMPLLLASSGRLAKFGA